MATEVANPTNRKNLPQRARRGRNPRLLAKEVSRPKWAACASACKAAAALAFPTPCAWTHKPATATKSSKNSAPVLFVDPKGSCI